MRRHIATAIALILGLGIGLPDAGAADVSHIYLYPQAKPNQPYHIICTVPGSPPDALPAIDAPGAYYPTIDVSGGQRTLRYTVGGLYGRVVTRPLTIEQCGIQSS